MTLPPVTRASAASVWIFCPEAAWLEQLYPQLESDSAREGTAAHEMAELILTGTASTLEALVGRPALNGVMMTDEMVPHVEVYVDHIRSRGVAWWVEKSISINAIHGEVTGRCDGAGFSFDDQSGMLYIDDFKYGFGPVEIFENWQQLIYAIGMHMNFRKAGNGTLIKNITMSIIQPRGYHHSGPIRPWVIPFESLDHYFTKLVAAMKAIHDPDRKCHAGLHCRYCKVHAFCAARKAAAMNAIDVVMKSIPDTDTPEQIAVLMDELKHAHDTIKHTLDAINARGEALILSGQPIPGYNFEPGRGKKRFIDAKQAQATAAVFGVDLTEIKTVTPAEAKRRGLSKAVVESLATTPSTAPRLVKRDASTLADKVFGI